MMNKIQKVAVMLARVLEVAVNNDACVIFKVKPNKRMNMIATGYLDGTETMFRLTKGNNITCTVFKGKDDKPISWSWGADGYILVSEPLKVLGKALQCCAEEYFLLRVREY